MSRALPFRRDVATAVADQALLSAFGFGLALVLVALWPAADFGVFVLLGTLQMLLASAQGALALMPLAVMLPAAGKAEGDAAIAAALIAALGIGAVGACAAYWLHLAYGAAHGGLGAAAAGYLGAQTLREHVRGVLFARQRPGDVLRSDAAMVGVAMLGLIILLWHGFFSLPGVVAVLAGAALLAIAPHGRAALGGAAGPRAGGVALGRLWRSSGAWALLGALTTEAQNRAYVFAAGGFFGAAALGQVQMAALLFRPIGLIAQAFARVARPHFARRLAAGDTASVRHITTTGAVAAVVASVLAAVALAVAWPQVDALVFRGAAAGLAPIAMLWGMATALALAAGVASVELQARGRFRELSVTSLAGAFAALAALAPIALAGDWRLLPLSPALGAAADLALVVWLLRRPARPVPVAATPA